MRIVLIGFMGGGKTTLTKALSEKLVIPAIDMDELIVAQSGRSSDTEIFEKDGERVFREIEMNVAKELQKRDTGIIATGGGVVMNKLTMDYLKTNETLIIYLKHSFETAQKRLQGDRIPPLFRDEKKARELYALRQPLYTYYADMIIETDNKTVEEIVEEIMRITN